MSYNGHFNPDYKNKTFEFHLPFHNYAGPGTHVIERLTKGYKPTTDLDYASLIHDIEYMDPRLTKEQADKNMVENLKRNGHYILSPTIKYTMKLFNRFGGKENDQNKYNIARELAESRGYIHKNMKFVN